MFKTACSHSSLWFLIGVILRCFPGKQAEASKGWKFLASTHLHLRSAQQRERKLTFHVSLLSNPDLLSLVPSVPGRTRPLSLTLCLLAFFLVLRMGPGSQPAWDMDLVGFCWPCLGAALILGRWYPRHSFGGVTQYCQEYLLFVLVEHWKDFKRICLFFFSFFFL